MFRARLPSIFSTSHKMPRLPRNFAPCRHLTQPWQCDSQKNTQHDTSQVLRLPRKVTMDTSEVLRLPRKLQFILRKRRKSIAPAARHKNDFHNTSRNTSECHKVARLPREMKQRDVWNLQKWHLLQNLPIRPYGHHANGCGRLRTVRQRRANTPSTPRPPEWNGNSC